MIVNRNELADAFATTVKTITTWQNRVEDPLPIVSKGKKGTSNEYDLAACIQWRIRQALKKAGIGSDGEIIDYERERAELTRAQKEGQQIKNELALGKIAPVHVLEFAISRVASECAGIIDTIPLNVKRKHPELTTQHIETVKRSCVKAQNTMARLGDSLATEIDNYINGLD